MIKTSKKSSCLPGNDVSKGKAIFKNHERDRLGIDPSTKSTLKARACNFLFDSRQNVDFLRMSQARAQFFSELERVPNDCATEERVRRRATAHLTIRTPH